MWCESSLGHLHIGWAFWQHLYECTTLLVTQRGSNLGEMHPCIQQLQSACLPCSSKGPFPHHHICGEPGGCNRRGERGRGVESVAHSASASTCKLYMLNQEGTPQKAIDNHRYRLYPFKHWAQGQMNQWRQRVRTLGGIAPPPMCIPSRCIMKKQTGLLFCHLRASAPSFQCCFTEMIVQSFAFVTLM